MTIQTFRKTYGTRNKCLKALLNLRLSEDNTCFNPKCDAPIDIFYAQMSKKPGFFCRRCLKQIFPQSNSPFENSHVPIEIWLEIIYRFLSAKGGLSAKELHRQYGFSYNTIYRIVSIIRNMMQRAIEFSFDGTVVEVDETYVKTGTKGYGRHHKFKRGRGSERNTSFLTIVERGPQSRVRLFKIPATDADSIIPLIVENTDTDSLIYTDQWGAYEQLKDLKYKHVIVNHSIQFVDHNTGGSTNAAENVHSNFKRMIVGTYRNISEGRCQEYANEYSFRYSFRNEEDFGMSVLLSANLSSLSEVYGKSNAA